ncbi:gliding motility-associated C-terminal domain-containing protein [Tenacibaculum sp. MAR_2009_124]|uniref:T9SS type B sorting domain-containing protein n=1 Tax=Tenacibaculum sp. MAR_2009_124 TaxID=1250059 RepID=UPI00089BB879|nr:T9SS type B sorting domain-containing protein [Tenacibaculum sp. MAR_2009_124]SEB83196.1 gliding motility-associated C-terminal domain-containing protein [Tenacibaculum sp. MAR_2009_124]
MRKLQLLTLTLFISFFTYAQKEANIWYFGENAGIDFNTVPPTGITNGVLNTLEGCSSFSNANGNLLFYSDGITVWDKNHNVMKYSNGNLANNLKGNPSSSQSGMIIPKPNSTSIYYLFTVDDGPDRDLNGNIIEPAQGFNVYTIDMSLNSGLGELIDENGNGGFFLNLSQGNQDDWTEKVAAVRSTECNTFWVVSSTSTQFYAYKITENGIDLTPVVSNITTNLSRRGYLKLSPDGTKLAVANQGNNQSLLFSFNNTTGQVASDGTSLTNFIDSEPYGVEFSRNSQKLYISTTAFFTDDINTPSTYKLFQFDLTQTNVVGTKELIHQQNGFRGALQLGPDGKIYATIPQTYSTPAGFTTHLDVIENPDSDADDVIFTIDAIDLNGRKSTQGLPPFISSLLLPIEIKDETTGTTVNNQDLQFCIGDSKTIAPDPVSGTNVTYEWIFNNGTTTSTISNNIALNLGPLTTNDAGEYKLIVTRTDDCGNTIEQEGVFKIEVYEATAASQPNDINFCDLDNDGFNSFDLQNDVTPQVLNGQSNTIFEVAYFLNQNDADNNTNALANPYTNQIAFSNQTIYARMHNIIAPGACYDIKTFNLSITGSPTPQSPTNYEVCDDIVNGGDMDGFYNNFILNTKDSEILGSLNATLYSITYHRTLIGAQTDNTTDIIDKNTPFRNEMANTQTIYVRVENNTNVACNDSSVSFNLIVNAVPNINTIVELKQCDDNTDAFADFNLEEARSDISSNFQNETFVFYESLNNAQNNISPISNPTVYRNTTATSDKVWATVTTVNGCMKISEVNLTVSTTGIPSTFQRTFNACDDYLDVNGNNSATNSDTDGITSFNFSSVDTEIRSMFTATGQQINVTYYENETDALAEQNAIQDISNFRNINSPNTQLIYVRVDSDLDNDCLGLGHHITLNVDAVPSANNVNDLEFCDDFLSGAFDDGINIGINLRGQVNSILGSLSPLDYTVSFHTSPADANANNNAIANDTNFTNTVRDNQTIYVRIENNNTGCFNDHVSFKIVIHPLPTISNSIPNLDVCDIPTSSDSDPRNRLAQNISLGDRDLDVLNGRDASQFEVSYHKTAQDALDGTNPLSKTNYSNDPLTTNFPANLTSDDPATEIIYISILNTTSGCRYGISTLQLVIYPEPNIPLNINNYVDCDNTTDSSNDDANGINGDVSLQTKIPEILANYTTSDHANYSVTFHANSEDAQSGSNTINSSTYENLNNNQEIFVRVVNNQTGCVNDNLSFNIIINPLPNFTVDSPVIVCLNNPQTRLESLNPMADYDYEWRLKGNNTILSNESYLDVTEGGIYVVKAIMKDGTNCERNIEITVNESINPTLNEDDIVVVDDTNNNGLDTYSIKIVTENNNLGIGDYQFSLLDETGNQNSFQDESLFTDITGGIYTVIVNDKNGCSPDASLTISVIQYPKFLTPNNDGYNDTWKVKGANSSFYPTSNIYIFDRYGKPVATIPVDGDGWDGTFNGNTLSSGDYWFKIHLTDKKGKDYFHNGHFSLLRK